MTLAPVATQRNVWARRLLFLALPLLGLAFQLTAKETALAMDGAPFNLDWLLTVVRLHWAQAMVLLEILAFGAWMVVLSEIKLSEAFPLSALSYVLVILTSWVWFHEHGSVLQVLGGAAILAGVWLMSRSSGSAASEATAVNRVCLALAAVVAAVALSGPAWAGEDTTWAVDLGAVARARPTHMGSDRTTTDILPIFEASYGDNVSLSAQDGVAATLWKHGSLSAGPVIEYRQSYNDHLPPGAFKMDDAVELGGFVKQRTPVGEVELRLRKAVTGYSGWSGDLAFDTGGQVSPNWKVGAEARVSWADSSFSREYFGLHHNVRVAMALPRLGENDFYSAGVEIDAARRLGPRTNFVIMISEDRILGEEWESPLLATRNMVEAAVGFTYRFGRLDTGKEH